MADGYRVAVVDDAAFDITGEIGAGKEVYSELVAEINEKLLGNEVLRIVLDGVSSRVRQGTRLYRVYGSRVPLLRILSDKTLTLSLDNIINKEKIDIIHINISNSRYAIPLIQWAKNRCTGIVVTVHSYQVLCPTGWKTMLPHFIPCTTRFPSPSCLKCIYGLSLLTKKDKVVVARGIIDTLAFRYLVKKADTVISPSKRFAKLLRTELALEPISAWNPVPTSFLLSRQPRGGDYAFFIGRLIHEKGAHLLPHLAKLLAPIELHVAGKGPLEEYIKRKAPSNLIYHGYVSLKEKIELYRGSGVVVVPSIWSEMYGYVVVEAFSAWKPVVAFNHAGPGELIESSGGGLLATPFNLKDLATKVKKIIRENLSEALGVKGYKFVKEKLSVERYAAVLRNIYKQVLLKKNNC